MIANQNKGRKGRKQGKKSSDNDSGSGDSRNEDTRNDDSRNEDTRNDDSRNEKQLNDNDDDSNQKSQEQSNDQAQNTYEESECKLRKVKIILDEKYNVPKCYAKFFSNENKEKRKDQKKKNAGNKFKKSNVLIEIITDKHKKKKNKTAFKLLWNPEIYQFADKKLNVIVEEFKGKFNSNCHLNDEEKSITISGCNLRELRDYMAKKYNIQNIPINNINTCLVPKNFKINITGKLGTKEIKVKWNPKDWMDQFSQDFVEDFVSQVQDKWRYEINLELKTQNIIVYCIKKENIDKKIKYYLKDSWKMKDDQINVQIDPRDKEPVFQQLENKNIINPLRKIKRMLKSKETSDPFIIKMATTIAEYRKYEKDKFKAHEIKTNLRFYRSGSNVSKKDQINNKNDEKIFNYWITSFEFVKKK